MQWVICRYLKAFFLLFQLFGLVILFCWHVKEIESKCWRNLFVLFLTSRSFFRVNIYTFITMVTDWRCEQLLLNNYVIITLLWESSDVLLYRIYEKEIKYDILWYIRELPGLAAAMGKCLRWLVIYYIYQPVLSLVRWRC